MPSRTRPASSTVTEVVEAPEEYQRLRPGLQFDEPLSWRAGKAIAVTDLLRRLQTLSKEMREMDQEEDERESFTKVAKELASQNLLAHKDKGVKAWAACCLVDILRLCAPDAPYTGQQLRDIFTMLITHILPALSDPSNAYNGQHMYVLQSLATVKSIVLVTDLPSSEPLVVHLFNSFFDILSGSSKNSTGEQLGKNVEINMTAILVIMVDEAPSLPTEAIDSIIAQFLRTDPRAFGRNISKGKKNGFGQMLEDKQSTLVLKEFPPAYNMAKTICNSCPEKMAREISQYFTEVITDASSTSRGKDRSHRRNSDDLDDTDGASIGPTEEDLKELQKAHALLRELWRASPGVLQNVIPQLEAELSAENFQLRLLATETFGDIVSGIGAAGPPPPPNMDVAAYPPITLSKSSDTSIPINLLTTPSSPQPFPQVHPHAYQSFLGRRQDKLPVIRAAWTTGIGRILITSAGGVGLSHHEEQLLVENLARMLNDSDEKVRLAAVRALGIFSFKDVMIKLGSLGSVDTPGSVLANLSERVKDRKIAVRGEAMRVLARIWALGLGEISAGDEQVIRIIGGAPGKILNAYYVNDPETTLLLDTVLFETLLPLSYPPVKAKALKPINGNSQRIMDSQTNGDSEVESLDPDKIRVERILLLAKSLDEKAMRVFRRYQQQQSVLSAYMSAYLQSCESYNGGIMEEDEAKVKERLTTLISILAKLLSDPSKVTSDLWKFAKMHDRRSYQLIRFCLAPESDYRTLYKALKELTKRIETSATAPTGLLETLIPLLYRSSIIIYNKSHVPAIMEFSKSDEKSLAAIAHVILKDISVQKPEVLKAHVQEICKSLQEDAPLENKANDPSAVDSLKACAGFAKKFPKEVPQDRKFLQAMTSFALWGTPPETAKHAVSIIMAASERKEMIAKDIVHKCVKDFQYGQDGFLSRLAALSQLWLLAPTEIDKDGDTVIDIAITEILLKVRTRSKESPDAYEWSAEVDSECAAKCWALKILVNRLRSHTTQSTLSEVAGPIYTLLSTLVSKEGELSSARDTPPTHKSRLRLLAGRLYLKLCTSKAHEALLTPSAFNQLALLAQDACILVREPFLQRVKKYLLHNTLTARFYTIPFLLAFEPDARFKAETATWLKSRASFFSELKQQSSFSSFPATEAKAGVVVNRASTVLENTFARLISLLAHHPDYGSSNSDLIDFGKYLVFYISNIANEENISLIYHIAQRVKGCRDAINSGIASNTKLQTSREKPMTEDFSERLYTLSDLAQLTIRVYEETHNWSIQTLPSLTRLSLPRSLFIEIKEHKEAMRIAEKVYLPSITDDEPDIKEGIEALVRKVKSATSGGGGRKRKSDGEDRIGETVGSKKVKRLPLREGKTKSSLKSLNNNTKKINKKTTAVGAKKVVEWDGSDGEEDDAAAAANTDTRSSEVPNSERRRSGRVSVVAIGKSYAEREDEEDDEEMEDLNREEDEKGKDDDDDGEDEAMEEEEEEVVVVVEPTMEIEGEDHDHDDIDNANPAISGENKEEEEEESEDQNLDSPIPPPSTKPSSKPKPLPKATLATKPTKPDPKATPTRRTPPRTRAPLPAPTPSSRSKSKATSKSVPKTKTKPNPKRQPQKQVVPTGRTTRSKTTSATKVDNLPVVVSEHDGAGAGAGAGGGGEEGIDAIVNVEAGKAKAKAKAKAKGEEEGEGEGESESDSELSDVLSI